VLGPVFHHRDFDAETIAVAKRRARQRVSVCLPARNEEATVGAIVSTVVGELVEGAGLVDEVVVLDDGSTDDTAAVATAAGARVVRVADALPDVEPGSGKGNVLWTSLYVAEGELLCWLDADLREFSSHFVVGLLGPLLTRPAVGFVKGFYRRPVAGPGDAPTQGGRVTELVARPLLSKLFPHLADVRQPLAGEFAARRDVVEQVPFVQGWGVEMGLLVDIADEFGARSLAQVDLGVRHHRNRPLRELAPQAMAILTTALRRAGLEDAGDLAAHLVTFGGDDQIVRLPVEVRERPPMIGVPAYRRLREQSA
jgi:glucosyl-3-phosphoglycerate synthase